MQFIIHSFTQVASQQNEENAEVSEGLILALGAMINLAELSDQARMSVVVEGDDLIDALATTFLAGSERAAQVCLCLLRQPKNVLT